MEIWQKELIRNLFHYSSKRVNIERAFMVKHPHVPDRLYKYRQFTANHLDALNKNVLWISSPDRFNDPYDAAVSFDTNRFFVEDRSVQEYLASLQELVRTVDAGGNWKPQKLIRPVQQGEWRRKIIGHMLKDMEVPDKGKILGLLEGFMKKHAEEGIRRISDAFRQGYSVLSLSKTYSSKLMWSHYSDAHKGFVIEYDFSRLPYSDLRRRLCFPVFYTKKLRDATRYLARTDMSDFNCLFGQYMCLIKQSDWAYEEEWRIIHAIGPSQANREVIMPEPSAIILGSQVNQADRNKMRRLCDARKIPLRCMVQLPGSFNLEVTNSTG